ncbi:50S ribosomal protein L31 [Buchnera aphidicola]|uniref:50S ribosomal protein L31 n=1 Tax=Buchnera aphidicola TaxID=9 RepID=UPI002091E6AD|nr:50S ribosomal protein L31 [Buchnera aphidicola]USS94117.1 50S ribosomal protein L31 [Buchnera aphidicola (Sipha maydis)]WII23664.1 50S ribosomal protein L31 [Buchnera aphidicola (Sipha maydis)]
MKKNIHPKYFCNSASCTCGNVINFFNTLGKDINLEVCSKCHPFYTGKQRIVDTGGRVELFNKRFNFSHK